MAKTRTQASLVGTVLAGRYRVERLLGRGGFAEVYLARHVEISSLKVAIKVLHPVHRERAVILRRFRREAGVLGLLRNRHTVRLIDFGSTEDETPYLVMEYVEGAPLDRVIRQQGAMRDSDVARVAIGTLKALAEAHDLGVVHRDLKPGNIFLVNEPGETHPVARVLDFGIAKVMGDPDTDVRSAAGSVLVAKTRTDAVFCTPMYAAPELLCGAPDFRTDLYALGLVMAEMLDGVGPYADRDCSFDCSPHLESAPVPLGPRTRASALLEITARACEKDADRRYRTALEMLAELEIAFGRLRQPDYREPPLRLNDGELPTPPPLPGPRTESCFVPISAHVTEEVSTARLQETTQPVREPAPDSPVEALQLPPAAYNASSLAVLSPTSRAHESERPRGIAPFVMTAAAAAVVVGAVGVLLWSSQERPPVATSATVPAALQEPAAPADGARGGSQAAGAPVAAPPVASAGAAAAGPASSPPLAVKSAVDDARRAVGDVARRASGVAVRVRATAPGVVWVDGAELAPLVATGDEWRLPPGVILPVDRPIDIQVIGAGAVVSRAVTADGPVEVAADLRQVARAAAPLPPARPPVGPSNRRASPATTPSPPAVETSSAVPSAGVLGPPITPRTR